MRRRRYLVALGAAGSLALAGCGDPPDVEGDVPDDSTPTRPPEPTREDLLAEFRSQLADRDIDVQTLEWDGDHLELEYYSDAGTGAEFSEEVQHVSVSVANSYGRYESLDVDRFDATAFAYNDDVLGEYYVEAEWVEELTAREIDEETYLERVRETVE